MGWIKQTDVDPKKLCGCKDRPDRLLISSGDIWQCDNCQEYWILGRLPGSWWVRLKGLRLRWALWRLERKRSR